MDANQLFSQVLLFVAQAGFAADVAPAAGACRCVWEDGRLWGVLQRVGPQEGDDDTPPPWHFAPPHHRSG